MMNTAAFFCRKDKRDAKFICHRSGTVPSIVVHIGWEPDDILSTTAVGWERVDGCPSPSFTDLGSSFNPLKLVIFLFHYHALEVKHVTVKFLLSFPFILSL